MFQWQRLLISQKTNHHNKIKLLFTPNFHAWFLTIKMNPVDSSGIFDKIGWKNSRLQNTKYLLNSNKVSNKTFYNFVFLAFIKMVISLNIWKFIHKKELLFTNQIWISMQLYKIINSIGMLKYLYNAIGHQHITFTFWS